MVLLEVIIEFFWVNDLFLEINIKFYFKVFFVDINFVILIVIIFFL